MIWPESGAMSPAKVRSSVLLPTPFGPTTPQRSPGSTVRETWSSITAGPKLTVMSLARSEVLMTSIHLMREAGASTQKERHHRSDTAPFGTSMN